MAIPVAFWYAAVTIATAAVSANSQKKTNDAQAEAAEQRQEEATKAAVLKMQKADREARKKRAAIRAEQAESGATGLSADLQIVDSLFQSSENSAIRDQNAEGQLDAIDSQYDAQSAGYSSNQLANALQIGSAGFSAYQSAPKKTPSSGAT